MRHTKRLRQRRNGTALVELSLLGPWLFLMFAGVLDFGFYSYALITTQNAARVAALFAASDESAATDEAGTCAAVLREMRSLPNAKDLQSCTALPLHVQLETEQAGAPPHTVARVSVTYQTVPLFPIPGLAGRLTATRTVEMRVKAS
jgi:Flp pilus assembly protein TadG